MFLDVVQYRNVSSSSIVQAISSLEGCVSSMPGQVDDIVGDWQLIYSSLIPTGYLPLKEILQFYPDFSLTSSVFGIPLGNVIGRSDIVSESSPIQLNLTTTEFHLGPIDIVYDLDKVKPKLYTFLYVDGGVCVARSSLGGYSIFKRYEPTPGPSNT